jgi:hypothetical protein
MAAGRWCQNQMFSLFPHLKHAGAVVFASILYPRCSCMKASGVVSPLASAGVADLV